MTKCFGHFLLSLNKIYLSSCHFVEFSVQSYKLFCKYVVAAPTFLLYIKVSNPHDPKPATPAMVLYKHLEINDIVIVG